MKKLEQILSKEVSRKQFLVLLGSGILGLFGLSAILGLFSEADTQQAEPRGYGMLDYGP